MLTGLTESPKRPRGRPKTKHAPLPEQRAVYIGKTGEYIDSIIAATNRYESFHFKFASTYEDMIELIYTYEPMLIIADLSEPYLDIIKKLAKIKRYHRAVTVGIAPLECPDVNGLKRDGIITEFVFVTKDIEHIIAIIMETLNNFLMFDINLKSLSDKMPIVNDIMWHDRSWDEERLKSSISDKLARLGVRRNLAGHRYLIAAIALQSTRVGPPNPIWLYERIADYYETTPLAVEKAIRYAIETAWMKGDIYYQHQMFGVSIDADKGKPTNAEFIARIALYFD